MDRIDTKSIFFFLNSIEIPENIFSPNEKKIEKKYI